jgi:3-isopropylmalate/(R)-2-methylmalate dehydratase large subunit
MPPMVTWGTSPEDVISITGAVPDPAFRRRGQARREEARAGIHGPRPPAHRSPKSPRPRVHRLLHQRPHRGSAHGRAPSKGKTSDPVSAMDRAGLRPHEGAGRGRRSRQDLHRRRLRMARAGLLDVPRHEPEISSPGERMRLDLEPQLRGSPGLSSGRTHLVSPAMAAAAALTGRFVDVRTLG